MGNKKNLLACALILTLPILARAADPAPAAPAQVNLPAYPSGTTAQPGQTTTNGIPTDTNAITPPPVDQAKSLGRFRTAAGTVKVADMLLNRYKESVVRVTALDNSGNTLGEAMGVAAGGKHIAAPLSLILGNSVQWADKIAITHYDGTQYFANIALVNEELNLVLLAPENGPAEIPLVRPLDERPQITIFAISLPPNAAPNIFEGKLSAVNQKNGTLAVTGDQIGDSQAGTAIINSQGELVGMLLPKRHGVLASKLTQLIDKAKKSEPLPPSMLGAVMGRGVVVKENLPGAYPTIGKALEAIKNGKAPKIDANFFEPAKDRLLSPKEADRLVVKVMPGTYKEKNLELPSYISLSGSGPKDTTLMSTDPNAPAILVKNAKHINISGFRIVPAALQKAQSATIAIEQSSDVQILGNILESKGGAAISANSSLSVVVVANVFPGTDRGDAIRCIRSIVRATGNGVLGAWPQGFVAGDMCTFEIERNLFMRNKVSIAGSNRSAAVSVGNNTFIDTIGGLHLEGKPRAIRLQSNVFFHSPFALSTSTQIPDQSLGRNSLWRSDFMVAGRKVVSSRILRSEPHFLNPARYDFRFPPGSPEYGSAPGAFKDFGAFQSDDFLGPNSSYFADALEVATGEKDLAKSWGIKR